MKPITDVFTGTWRADRDRSELDPNHRFREAAIHLTPSAAGYELRAEGVGPDGQPSSQTAMIVLDGMWHDEPAVEGVSVAGKWLDERTISVEAKRGETIVGKASYEVSADNSSLTAETWGTDSDGRPFRTRVVFDRTA